MSLYYKLLHKQKKLAVIGLGYVGIPIAIAFSKHFDVIGFDINQEKLQLYQQGIDPTKEVGDETILNSTILFTNKEEDLQEAGFIIIAVPTPVRSDHTPDLTSVMKATQIVGRNLKQGTIIVYESTVYPGVTEEFCLPILEKESHLLPGIDFYIGYSPERINPGDPFHKLENITKIVSGMDKETCDTIAKIYELIIKAGIYKAESIKVAEAAKVIENSQRDINIAFMNELSIIFHKMKIDTQQVLKAACTKWNFLPFSPGLVGGHCIGVDPYYLTYKAEQLGYHSQIILAGRRINNEMGKYIVEHLIKAFIQINIPLNNAKVAILGFTFKENCPDTRNTKVIDIIKELKEYGITPLVTDHIAQKQDVYQEYGIHFTNLKDIHSIDAIILAVAHKEYYEISLEELNTFYRQDRKKIIFDLKGVFNSQLFPNAEFYYWTL